MKRKKIRGKRSTTRDVVHSESFDYDIYSDDYSDSAGPVSRPDDDDDEWSGTYGSRFDVARWYEDIARRSSNRQRMRDNDLRRGTWRSAGT